MTVPGLSTPGAVAPGVGGREAGSFGGKNGELCWALEGVEAIQNAGAKTLQEKK